MVRPDVKAPDAKGCRIWVHGIGRSYPLFFPLCRQGLKLAITLQCAIRISLLLWMPSFKHHDVDGMKSHGVWMLRDVEG
jgi:hypothetical protein